MLLPLLRGDNHIPDLTPLHIDQHLIYPAELLPLRILHRELLQVLQTPDLRPLVRSQTEHRSDAEKLVDPLCLVGIERYLPISALRLLQLIGIHLQCQPLLLRIDIESMPRDHILLSWLLRRRGDDIFESPLLQVSQNLIDLPDFLPLQVANCKLPEIVPGTDLLSTSLTHATLLVLLVLSRHRPCPQDQTGDESGYGK